MYLIGLTGGIAAGKTLVANWFRHQRIPVVDADAVAREVLESDAALLARVRERFGPGVFAEDGSLLRRELGRLVFGDAGALQELNEMVYPELARSLDSRLEALEDQPLVVLDAALIFEWGIEESCDEIWVVLAPDEQRIDRLLRTRGFSPEEAHERIASQIPQEDKARRAHRVIENAAGVAELASRLREEVAPLFTGLGLSLREDSTP
ncbi:MAG: dephospho-CoA kinase [Calditrichaeota bacterium]|nr:dephospho-CoA kinase [Calditrichota bacterium]